MKVVVVLLLFAAVAYGMLGVDVSSGVSSSAFKCLQGAGYDFVVVRCFRSSGTVDPACPATVSAASGVESSVDLYMFPCPLCSASGASQVETLANYIKQNNIQYGRVWLDIEDTSPQKYWSTNPSTNQAFYQSMVSGASSMGLNIGVYTDKTMWTLVMGSSYSGGSNLPLWYSHYDNNPSFSDWQSFAGWSQPYMKQYAGDVTVCGVGVDKNYVSGGSETTSSSSGPSSSGPSSSGPSSSGPSSSGPSSNSGHGPSSSGPSSSGSSSNSTGKTTGSGSGPSSSGPSSGPSSSGHGPSSSGPSSSNGKTTGSGNGPSSSGSSSNSTGNGNGNGSGSGSSSNSTGTDGPSSNSGYSSGSSSGSSGSSGSGQGFLEGSIFRGNPNQLGGHKNKIDIIEKKPPMAPVSRRLAREMEVPELDDQKEEHFQIWEEKTSKKF